MKNWYFVKIIAVILSLTSILLVLLMSLGTSGPNPYQPAWDSFVGELNAEGLAVEFGKPNIGQSLLKIYPVEQCDLSSEEIFEQKILPAFAENNDILCYLDERYGGSGAVSITVYDGEAQYRYSVGLTSYRYDYDETITYNLTDYRKEIHDSGLTCDLENDVCSLYDISEYVVWISGEYCHWYRWSSYTTFVYIDTSCSEEELNRIIDTAEAIHDDGSNILFLDAETRDAIWTK